MKSNRKVTQKRRSLTVREKSDEFSKQKLSKLDNKLLKSKPNPRTNADSAASKNASNSVRKLASLKKKISGLKKNVMAHKTESKGSVSKIQKQFPKNRNKECCKEEDMAYCLTEMQKTAINNRTISPLKTKSDLSKTTSGVCVTKTVLPESNSDIKAEDVSSVVDCVNLSTYTPTTRSVSGGKSGKLLEGLPNSTRKVNSYTCNKNNKKYNSKLRARNIDNPKALIIIQNMKRGHWCVRRAQREASLNALAKVHLLYENGCRSNGTGETSDRVKDGGGVLYHRKHEEKRKTEPKKTPYKQNNSNKIAKKKKERIKRIRREIMNGEIFDTKSCKRMANLNAQAILSASYCQEQWRKERLEKKVSSPVAVRYERVEAFSVHSSITESTKEREMHVTTCNAQLVVTPHKKNECMKVEKTSSVSKGKRHQTKTAKIRNMSVNRFEVGRQQKTQLEVQTTIPSDIIPISCQMQTISSSSESNHAVTSTGLGKVGMAQYTEVTKVQINRRKEMEVKEEMGSQKKKESILANDDVAITHMYHYQTKAANQSYRLQMQTTYKPILASKYTSPERQQQKTKRNVSSTGHVLHPVMHGSQNYYNYSNHNSVVPSSSPQSFMNPNMNGMNNMAMVGVGPISTNYRSSLSVPHFGHSPSMPYTPSEYNGYYQSPGPILQPVLDPCLIHKPVPCHPPQHHHLHPPPPPPSQPHNQYPNGDRCLSRHALTPTPSFPMESIPQPHYPQETMNHNNLSHCFNHDVPHGSPSMAYYPHDVSHSANPPPPPPTYSHENISQNNNVPRGFRQDLLSHNNHQFLQNEISNPPRPHYPHDPLPPHNLPPHGFRQDCISSNVPHHHYSQDIPTRTQAPLPYTGLPDVLPPSSSTNSCYSKEHIVVPSQQRLGNQPSSCPSFPPNSSATHPTFHGTIHNSNFYCQPNNASVQQYHHSQPQNTMYPKHQINNIPRDYSPGPTYHELTPVITSRQKEIRTKTAPPEVSVPQVPKAEPVTPPEVKESQQRVQFPSNPRSSGCNDPKFPQSEPDKVIRGEYGQESPQCSNPDSVLNRQITSNSKKDLPLDHTMNQNVPSFSLQNENQSTSSPRTSNFKNHNIASNFSNLKNDEELKRKRRMRKSNVLDHNTSSSDSETCSNSLTNGSESFQESKLLVSKVKTKQKQPKKMFHLNKQRNVAVEKQVKNKIKFVNNTNTNNLQINGSFSSLKQELAKKNGKKKYSNGWSWEGDPYEKLVLFSNDDPPRYIKCFPAMRHLEGDIIRVRDCVLLKSGPKKTDLPFVAKIVALWESIEDGEMMMSLMWYYRPEHTEQGRRPQDMEDEIFASKHRDVNSVACVEDKCYVLTFAEYCRYRKGVKLIEEELNPKSSVVPQTEEVYPRVSRLPPGRVSPEMIFFCRKVYDFRQKRLLKNPM